MRMPAGTRRTGRRGVSFQAVNSSRALMQWPLPSPCRRPGSTLTCSFDTAAAGPVVSTWCTQHTWRACIVDEHVNMVDHALRCVSKCCNGCGVRHIQLHDRHVAAQRVLQLLRGALLPHRGDHLVAPLLKLLCKLQGQRNEHLGLRVIWLAVR